MVLRIPFDHREWTGPIGTESPSCNIGAAQEALSCYSTAGLSACIVPTVAGMSHFPSWVSIHLACSLGFPACLTHSGVLVEQGDPVSGQAQAWPHLTSAQPELNHPGDLPTTPLSSQKDYHLPTDPSLSWAGHPLWLVRWREHPQDSIHLRHQGICSWSD